MKFTDTNIDGLKIIESVKFNDERGGFYRAYCENEFKNAGLNHHWVQANISLNSKAGTIRGLHFQMPPFAENKLVRCIRGELFDVVVDLRTNSASYLKSYTIVLKEADSIGIYIPRGCAHGFQTLVDDTQVLYLHSEFYNSSAEAGLRYNDPRLGIVWPLEVTAISSRDEGFGILDDNFKGLDI